MKKALGVFLMTAMAFGAFACAVGRGLGHWHHRFQEQL